MDESSVLCSYRRHSKNFFSLQSFFFFQSKLIGICIQCCSIRLLNFLTYHSYSTAMHYWLNCRNQLLMRRSTNLGPFITLKLYHTETELNWTQLEFWTRAFQRQRTQHSKPGLSAVNCPINKHNVKKSSSPTPLRERERFLFAKANIQYQYHKTITSGRLPDGITRQAGCL